MRFSGPKQTCFAASDVDPVNGLTPAFFFIQSEVSIRSTCNEQCCKTSCTFLEPVLPQAAQVHYVWVRASEVIWSEYTRIITVLSDAK